MNKLVFKFFLLFLPLISISQHINKFWSVSNTKLSEPKILEFNSLLTSRYAFNENFQLATNIFLFPIAPNFQLKTLLIDKQKNIDKPKKFLSKLNFTLANTTTFYSPFNLTFINYYLQNSNLNLPNTLYINSEFFLSFPKRKICAKSPTLFSLKFGFNIAIGHKKDMFLKNPVIYPYFVSSNKGKVFFAGFTLDRKLAYNLNFSESLRIFDLGNSSYAFENFLFVYLDFGLRKKSRLAFGLITTYLTESSKLSVIPLFNYTRYIKFKSKYKSDIYEYLQPH